MEWLFGKSLTPKEQVKNWTSQLRKEQLALDREIRKLQREEEKLKAELKKAAAKGQKTVCVTFAKSLVRSKKTCDRMLECKTQIGSVMTNLKLNLATIQVAGQMKNSTVIMKALNNMISLPQVSAVARQMSQEMAKAGVIEEMVDDAISQTDSPELESEAAEEVDKVLWELTQGQMGQMPAVVKKSLEEKKEQKVEVQDNKEEDEMNARLSAL